MRRQKVLENIKQKQLTMGQGADILKLSVRQLRRIRRRYEQEGEAGLRDRRSGREPSSRIGEGVRRTLRELKAERYPDFSVRHFYEFARERHGITASYSTVLRTLQEAQLVEPPRRRGTYRRRRARQPMVGMRLHLDSSTHLWLGPEQPAWDLTVMADDATGRIVSARFSAQEGTRSTLLALSDVLTTYGAFCELYTDRGSHFCQITEAQQGPDVVQNTQLSRVLKTLAIRHIWAHSPQARGRSERIFGTLQNRLPQELRLAGITDYDAANRYLREQFVPDYNRRFTVEPAEPESLYRALPPGLNVQLLLSEQETRVVRKDTTIQVDSQKLQLPQAASRWIGRKVILHRFLDDTLGVSDGQTLWATFHTHGAPLHSPPSLPPLSRPARRIKRPPPPPKVDPVSRRGDLFHLEWSNTPQSGHL